MDNQTAAGGGLALAEVCKPLRKWMSWVDAIFYACYPPLNPKSASEFMRLAGLIELAKSARVWPCNGSSCDELDNVCDFAIAESVQLRLLDRERDILISMPCDGYAGGIDPFSPDEQADCAVLYIARERIDEFCRRNRITRLALWVANLPGSTTMKYPIPAAAEFEVEPTCRPYLYEMGIELREIIGHPVSLVSGGLMVSWHGS